MTKSAQGGKTTQQVKEQSEVYDEFDRFELIEGIRYDFKPSPTFNHQLLANQINLSISQTCAMKGIIVTAPMDVYLDAENVVQPDIIYISNENTQIVTPRRIEGAPDLVVEILSPSTGTRDKIRKKSLYARYGIKEYWIVDPVHTTVDQFVLVDEHYLLHATYGEQDTVTSPELSCISVDLLPIFQVLDRFREKD